MSNSFKFIHSPLSLQVEFPDFLSTVHRAFLIGHWWSPVGESIGKTVPVNQASRVYSLSVTLLGIRHVWKLFGQIGLYRQV